MYCLYCGDCCLRMSPISHPEPCPNIIKNDTFYFCKDYKNRPDECKNHQFPSRFCPIGMEKLNLDTPDKTRKRIDDGWSLIEKEDS